MSDRGVTARGERLRIGIDLGGTKIEVLALGASGHERLRRRVATPRGDYAATVAAIRELVTAVESELGAEGSVGVGIPGTISPASGRVKNANATWLNGQPLDHDLEQALGRPVRLANDANCLAVSEATDGAAAGVEAVFAVILGTGVGGGIAIGGRPLTGLQAIAGEWGHNPLPWPEARELPGPDCYCGKRGCIETWLSGPGMAADFARVTGERATTHAILERADNADPAAVAALERYIDRLARGLATVINLLDPGMVVLGGGMSNLEGLCPAVEQRLVRYVFSDACTTPVRRALHGDSSGVRGAAWLWGPAAD